MADLKISALNSLAGADLVAADVVAVVDDSASETKKLTVSDLIGNGVTLISNSTIPSAKILFSAGAIDTAELAASAVETAKINDSAVTAAKLADNSSVTLVSTLPASGDFTGQIALDTDDDKIYIWDGSAWDSVKGAGSINVVNGSTSGIVNITTSTSGDTVTVSTTLDDTTAAAQFLAGPTGAAGTVGYRAIIGTDLPAATTTTKGAVIVNGEGLRMDSDTIEIDNDLTANTSSFQAVKFDSKGLITSGRDITSADLPNATSGATGAVKPGTGLEMGTGGAIDHSNSVTGATKTKITFDAQGHVTAGTDLAASDVPDLDTAKITTGTFPTARIADDAITAAKLGDKSTTTIAETTPAGGSFIGQAHFNSISGDFLVWDGNVWQPIGVSVGEIVLAGTYDASTNLMATVTSEGTSLSYVVGSALPAASASNKGYYVVVSEAGTGTSPAPTVALNPPDFLLSTGTAYTEIDVSSTVVAQVAENISFTAAGNLSSTNVQAAIEELDTEKVGSASPTFTGTVGLGTAATIQFEGATSNAFETTLTVVDPTADRTVSLPNVTGTLISSGDTGTVTSTMILDGTIANADISSSAEIAVSKLANGTARQLLQTDSGGTGVEFTSNVDVPGTFDCTGAGAFDSTLTVTGLISADGKVSFPAGTASAPSFYFGTDTNTGLYHSAADEVAITTAGTQRVVVDSSGRVLIGPSSSRSVGDAVNLQIEGTDQPTSSLSATRNSANAAGPTLSFGKSRGSSVGSNTVVQNNDLLGNINFFGADGTDANTKSASIQAFVDGTPGSNDMPGRLVFSTTADGAASPSERLRIDSSGNVGIGTTSPSQSLTLRGEQFIETNSTAADSGNGIYWQSTTSGWTTSSAHAAIYGKRVNASNGYLRFDTRSSGTTAERMRIDSSGNVGIGTNSPSNLLHIHQSDTSENSYVHITHVDGGSAATDGLSIGLESNGINASIRNRENGYLRMFTNNTERMRIDSSGNVGISTASPAGKLSVGPNQDIVFGNQASSGTTGTGRLVATGGIVYLQAGLAATSGSDAPLVVTGYGGVGERLRIDSSGRLLVGTSAAGAGAFGTVPFFHAASISSANLFQNYGATTFPSRIDLCKTRGTSANSHVVVQNNDTVGAIYFSGSDGTDYAQVAQIEALVDGTPGSNDMPGRLIFSTTSDGAQYGTEAMRIDSKQRVTVKKSSVGEIDALTSASTITPDFAASNNFSVTLGTNATLANPSNLTAGQSGVIAITQDSTGSRTLAYGSKFKFAGGTAPTLTTTASAVDILTYYVESTSRITAQVLLNVS